MIGSQSLQSNGGNEKKVDSTAVLNSRDWNCGHPIKRSCQPRVTLANRPRNGRLSLRGASFFENMHTAQALSMLACAPHVSHS